MLFAQSFFPPKKYPKDAFKNPLEIPISLAGNFGECRPNHFHSGLDIRTNKVENLPVHAIADGYIARVKIEAGGFGNCIYINHMGGYTSLYAHLNKFYPELDAYIRYLQYKNKSWDIDVQFLPHEFPLRQGKFIAFSGNTGSSQAPHLHMEIRDTKTEKPLNGLLFYNLLDTKSPIIKKLAVYDGNKSIYSQTPKLYNAIKKGTTYITGTETIQIASNEVAFGITADDPMDGALGVLGVYEMDMYVDGEPNFGWQLDNIGYEETRYMNALADYKLKKNGGPWIQICYQLSQDNLAIHKSFTRLDGKVLLDDNKSHQIKILVKDVAGNSSVMQFSVQKNGTTSPSTSKMLEANKDNNFKSADIAFVLKKGLIYDDVPQNISTLPSSETYSYSYKINTSDIPVHDYFALKLKPKTTIPNSLSSKVAMVLMPFNTNEKNKKGKAAKLENDWAVANVREFGTYQLQIDETPPSITTTLKNNANIATLKTLNFVVKDATTFVKDATLTIDGQWLRLVQKGNNFYYEIDDYCKPGTHTLVISATDDNGNTSTQSFRITK